MKAGKHYVLYGHGGSYNHGAEALARTTIALLRRRSPGCRITLSTHFAEQDREFGLDADELVERAAGAAPAGGGARAVAPPAGYSAYEEIYAPTIGKIGPGSVCLHTGGDNYCYKNWQRWAAIHCAALARGAASVLWSCSVDPEMADAEMLGALRSHHLITAREESTYNFLVGAGLANVVRVSDIAFSLVPEPVAPEDFELDNYVTVNASPLVFRRNPRALPAYQALLDFILSETDMGVALVPHVVQPVDDDREALRALDDRGSGCVRLVPGNLSAGQLKTIIGKSRLCVAARTHAAIAAYSSCVPALAVSYSPKSRGIADDVQMGGYVADVGGITGGTELADAFRAMLEERDALAARLERLMPAYIGNCAGEKA
ncbi:MAG: polysaccharide pyruvyl transferase family protein, partial [Clostridiales bacterium]|nr:polysaccharide pyruvyl transferase family protein [Clostridiales bacterium]